MFKRIKNNPICYLVGRLWEFGEGRRVAIIISMVMASGAMAAWLTVPLIMSQFVQAAQAERGSGDLSRCAWLIALTVVMGVVGWLFHGPGRVCEMLSAFTVRKNVQMGLLTKTLRLPMNWHQSHHSGETIDQVSRAASAMADFADTGTLVLQIFAKFIGAVVMMSIFMPKAGVVVFTTAAIAVAIIVVFDKVLVPLYDEGNKTLNKVASKVQDYLTNIRTVLSLRLEDRVADEVAQQMLKLRPITKKTSILMESKWFTANILVDITRALTIFWFVWDGAREGKAVELGALFALNEYLISIGSSFFELTWRWGDLVIKATRLKAVESLERDYAQLVGHSSEAILPSGWSELRIENVSYKHGTDSSESSGVFGVSLSLHRGKTYAVVGSSGCGKSTLLSLLRGLNRAESGTVLCDGDVVPQGLAAVAHVTTLVPQDPEVFADSVLKNVTMGIQAPREKVMAAIEMARFSDVLARLPKGLDTNIAEKGISMSGGEKQRLALARGVFFAFDGESEIVLLDESTSGVDVVTERKVYISLLKHFSREVVIATTHKFNLLPLFDEIIVMDKGRIVEQGTLEELLTMKGFFATMWREYSGSQALSKVAM